MNPLSYLLLKYPECYSSNVYLKEDGQLQTFNTLSYKPAAAQT